MIKNIVHIVHSLDGYADGDGGDANDFVEIDGVKYKQDPDNEGEALKGEDGKPVPYEEKKAGDDDKGGKKDDGDGGKKDEPKDPSKMSLDELKKLNPDVAKALQEGDDARKQLEEAEEKRQKEEEEKLKEQGKWQELAESAKTEAQKAKDEAKKANELLGKYKGTVDSLLESVLGQVPDDKKGLIPSGFSNRQKLEYAIENSKFLGISVVNKGGGVPPNDGNAPTDDEGELQKELNDLMAKESRTYTEDQRMIEVSKKLKEVRKAKEDSQKK